MKSLHRQLVLFSGLVLHSLFLTNCLANSKVPFIVVTTPNPQLKQAVMAIVSTTPNTSARRAASLGAFAVRQFRSSTPWQEWHVFVFADATTAQRFKEYQIKRRQKPLQAADYRALQALWPRTLAVYQLKNTRETIKYPQYAPRDWWRDLTTKQAARQR